MSKNPSGTESVLDLIHQATLRKLAESELFDETTLSELETLAASGRLKYASPVTRAIEVKPGDTDENPEA